MSRTAHRLVAKRTARNSSILQLILRWLVKLRLIWIILIAFLFLSGCVRYEVGLTFQDANHGTIVQHVQLSNQLTGVSRATANLWLDQLAAQAQQLGGKTRHPSEREWVMTIPFYNAKDLATKFDRFFQVVTAASFAGKRSMESAPVSQFQIQTNNLILWQRNHLQYDLDLRSLAVIPDADNTATLLINPKDLLNLEFTLNTADGAQSVNSSVSPIIRKQGKQLVWSLQPGEVNHLEVIFWVPSPIGIGAAVIIVLVIGGMFAKAWTNPSSLIELPLDVE